MRSLQFAGLLAAFSIAAAYAVISEKTMSAVSPEEVEADSALSSAIVTASLPAPHGPLLVPKNGTSFSTSANETSFSAFEKEQARLEETFAALEPQPRTEDLIPDHPADAAAPAKRDFSYLAFYAFSEIPPEEKPAETILDTLKGVPVGTPIEEIKRASDAFGLDFNFMKAVAKIESGFNPKQRTGSYIGLFQLSNYEFKQYGSGNIISPRDNAIAGAYKFAAEALLFEYDTGKKPTFSDLYLIHQQGWQGAAEHVSHPKRIAWRSMCATDEGKEKGERWCKRAIWGNTLPVVKKT